MLLIIALFAALMNARCTIEQAPVTIVTGTASTPTVPTVPIVPTIDPPLTPILSASGQNGSVLISWTATGSTYTLSDEFGVTVYSGSSLSYTVALTNGTSGRYTVTALNSAGQSAPSAQVTAMAGVIDNNDGTVSVINLNQRWDKCALGQYNPLTNGCDFPANTYQYCTTDNYGVCDDWNVLTSGPAFDACNGIAKRVPTSAEVMSFVPIYTGNPDLFAGLDTGWAWTSTAVNPTMCSPDGNCAGPGMTSGRLRYLPVRCVRDGL